MQPLLDKLLYAAPEPDSVNAQRQTAQKNLLRHGLPTLRDERWKYTSLKLLERREYSDAASLDADAALAQAREIIGDLPSGGLVVFVDGHCLLAGTPDWLHDLTGLLQHDDSSAGDVLAPDVLAEASASDGFIWLNLARARSGLVLDVPAGVQMEQPLHVVYLAAADDQPQARHLRHHWCLGEGAHIELIEHHAAGGAGFDNIYRSIELAANSQLEWLTLQQAGNEFALLQHNHIRQQQGAQCRQTVLDLGARLARQETRVSLAAEGGEYDYAGLLLGRQRQHHDQHVLVRHDAPGCRSGQTYRAVLSGHARGVVNTAALVSAGADGSDVEQNTASLLLSQNAEMDAKPELEIHADEVAASHGATIGQLDQDALFYLRSRGIAEQQARQMLIAGFAGAIVDKIKGDARDHAQGLVDRHLEQLL